MRARATGFVWLIVLSIVMPAGAQPCAGTAPVVNKLGFRPLATIAYEVGPSPDGRPFPSEMLTCVWRAFQAWTATNSNSGLDVRFVPGPGGLRVRYDSKAGRLPSRAAGAWTDATRGADGALERATVWLSSDRRLLDDCVGVTKTMLHELGHLHGLADHYGEAGDSVMNPLDRKNDRGGRVPLQPTSCDAAQALKAASSVLAVARVASVELGDGSATVFLADQERARGRR